MNACSSSMGHHAAWQSMHNNGKHGLLQKCRNKMIEAGQERIQQEQGMRKLNSFYNSDTAVMIMTSFTFTHASGSLSSQAFNFPPRLDDQ